MKIINKLTLRHLKENKKRTVMTVIGIIVSVAMLTATCVSVTSFADMMAHEELYSAGDWHANIEEASTQQIETLEKNGDLKYVGVYKTLDGEVYSFNLHNEAHASAGIGEIGAGNRDYFSAFVTGKFIGAVPKDETEIMVTRSLLTKNELNWEIGDKVTIDLGKRYITDESGEKLLTAHSYTIGETFESTGKKTFTVVGILEDNRPTQGTDILRGLSHDEIDGATVYLTANTLNRGTEETLKNDLQSAGIDQKQMSVHKDLFRYNWIVRDTDNTMQVLINFALILVVIIIFASVMLIYNAFSISISERSRYLGMLASVGATKAQKRRSVYFESVVLGLIGIPLGFGAGLLGIGITFKAISPLLQESGLNSHAALKLSFPLWILPIIAVLSIITLAVSAYVPARRASRTTPIDALRQTNDVKVKSRKLRVPKIVRTVFGYEGELAYKNLKRNGKKSRVITSALVLSVVLFLSVNTFCSMFQEANKTTESIPYQITVAYPDAEKDRLYKDMQQIDGIDAFYSALNQFFYDVHFSEQYYKSAYRDTYAKKGVTVSMNILDDADFNALCTENKIDYKLFYEKTDDLPILILNSDGRSENSPSIFEDSLVGTALPLTGGDSSLYKLTVQGLIRYHNSDLRAYNLTSSVIIAAYAPYSAVKENPAFEDTYSMGFVGIETDTAAAVSEAVQNLLETGNYQNSYVSNLQEQTEAMNATITVMQVFIYGFIALITMIAVVNIFNTVSTGIDLRRKEFAMLKSVGITPRGFRKMLRFESLFYGLKALFYGLPISLGISVMMWKALTDGFEIPFHPDWRIYLGVTVAVFFITGISMTYATAKVKKDSIIATLKSEIN